MDTEQRFAFDLSPELTKLVSVKPIGRDLEVHVRFAGQAVMDEFRTMIFSPRGIKLTTDDAGLIVRWKSALLPGLPWPVMTRKRRF